jgi:hypothetical protein
MLIALAIMLLGGGGSDVWLLPSNFDKQIKNVVVDENRQADIIEDVEKINDSIASYVDEVKQTAKNISSLNKDHAAGEQEFEAVINELLEKRKTVQIQVVEARLHMAAQLQSDEWEQLFNPKNEKENNE